MALSPNQAAPSTAAQVLDAPDSPSKTLVAGASTPPAQDKAVAPAPAADDKVSNKIQVLIQRERAAVERERSATTKEAQAVAREQALAAREAKITEFESLKQTNPMKALELLGMSYQDLTQVALNDGSVPAEVQLKKLEDKLNSFTQSQEAAAKQQAEDSKKQEEQAHAKRISEFQSEIGAYLKENVTRYELIAFEQSEGLVYDVIDENYNRTLAAATKAAEEAGEPTDDIRGEVMTIAQAADKVELHLEQKYLKAKDLVKVKGFLGVRPETTAPKPQIPARQTPKTLTNTQSATPSRPKIRTDEERKRDAIAFAQALRPSA